MPARVLQDLCNGLRPSEPSSYESLTFVPLVRPSADDPAYELFNGQMPDVAITEIDESGSVPTLRVQNRRPLRLLLIDGQQLLGAKQNRILNTTILVPAESDLEIPVSCVERGRWGFGSHRRPDIAPEEAPSRTPACKPGSPAPPSMRAGKAAYLAESLKVDPSYCADQGQVWLCVDRALDAANAESPSAAMQDIYEQRADRLAEVHEAVRLPDDAVGVAVFIGGRFVGLDVFDKAATLHTYLRPLVDGYALDWLVRQLDSDTANGCPDADVAAMLKHLSDTTWDEHKSPGEGKDLRMTGVGLVASALVWNDQTVVHLQAFPANPNVTPGRAAPEPRESRPPFDRSHRFRQT